MTVALALLAGAAVTGWFLPGVLRRANLGRRDPLLLMVAWLVSMVGVLFAVAAGVGLLFLPDHGSGVLAVVHDCWSELRHGSPPSVEAFAGMAGLVLLVAFTFRLSCVSWRGVRARTRTRREHLAVLRLAARSEAGTPDTWWLPHGRPLAFSLAGGRGVIVATDGLADRLGEDEVAAVFAHERAHLRGRHHVVVATVDALRTALPFVPLFRLAPHAVRELVELSADVAAVRQCGAAAVRAALLAISRGGAPGGSLAMAEDAVDIRLARLRTTPAAPGKVRRAFSCATAGITAAALPFLFGTGLLVGLAMVSCLPGAG